jgi:hypothetical protein
MTATAQQHETTVRSITPEMIAEARRMEIAGNLEPEKVWRAARQVNHPMHGWFTWSVREAAEKCWEQQARDLIRRIVVYVQEVKGEGPAQPLKVFVHHPGDSQAGYVAVERLKGEDAALFLEEELARIRGHIMRGWSLAGQLGRTRSFRRSLFELLKELK